MNILIEYKNRPVSDYVGLIGSYPSSEFDSPYRSTVPFLYFWANINEGLDSYTDWFGFRFSTPVTAGFEFSVDVQRGQGKPSQTDLMITSHDQAIAIEAKYTEPRYEFVESWLGGSENRTNVLEGWLDLIRSAVGESEIEVTDILGLPYQMVHRYASACFPSATHRALIYQCFDLDEEKVEYYRSQLQSLSGILNKLDNLSCFVLNIPLVKSSDYAELQRQWDRSERKMHQDVIRCMKNMGFMEFGKPTIIRIE